MKSPRWAFIVAVAAAQVFMPLANPRAQYPEMNPSLLGVVSEPATDGVRLLRVLEHAPADEAGLESGDVLTLVADHSVSTPEELDKALASYQAGSRIELTWVRDGKQHTGTANVIHWRTYRGTFLRGRAQGDTGFAAPEWYAYAWDHGKPGSPGSPESSPAAAPTHENLTHENPTRENPTRENTVGKVVVIHAFQSW